MGVGSIVGSGVASGVEVAGICGDIVARGRGVGLPTGGGTVAVGTGTGSAEHAKAATPAAATNPASMYLRIVTFIYPSIRLDANIPAGVQATGSVRHIIH